MAKSKPVPKAPAPLLNCPFTGEKLDVVYNERLLQWCARGKFWSTRWFDNEDQLFYALSHRDGDEPAWKPAVITLTDRQPPPANPMADKIAVGKALVDLAGKMPLAKTVQDALS